MSLVLMLFLVGVILLAADLFVSGFVLGVFGGLAMLAATLLVLRDYGSVAAVAAGGGAIVLLGLAVYLELVWLPNSRLGRNLVVHSTDAGTSQEPLAAAAAVLGRPAVAATTLAPSGYVLVDGRRFEAFCRSGHAAKGTELRVVAVDNFRLVVSKEPNP